MKCPNRKSPEYKSLMDATGNNQYVSDAVFQLSETRPIIQGYNAIFGTKIIDFSLFKDGVFRDGTKQYSLESSQWYKNAVSASNMIVTGYETQNDSDVYTKPGEPNMFVRSTHFLANMYKRFVSDPVQYKVDRMFPEGTTTRDIELDDRQTVVTFTKQEYEKYERSKVKYKTFRGTIKHKLLEMDGDLTNSEFIDFAAKTEKEYQNGRVKQNIETLFEGTELKDESQKIKEYLAKSNHGNWFKEVTVKLNLPLKVRRLFSDTDDTDMQGIMSTIDLMIFNSDGRVSIFDYKSGRLSSVVKTSQMLDKISSKLIREGKTELTARDIAFMQVLLQMIIVKANNPNIEFDSGGIVDSDYKRHYIKDANLALLLGLFNDYFSSAVPDWHKSNSQLFEPSTYLGKDKTDNGGVGTIVRAHLEDSGIDTKNPNLVYKKTKEYLGNKIQIVRAKLTRLRAKEFPSDEDLDEIAILSGEQLKWSAAMSKLLAGHDLFESGEALQKDRSAFWSRLMNRYSVNNPIVNVFQTLFDEGKAQRNKDVTKSNYDFDKVHRKIASNIYMPKEGMDFKKEFAWAWRDSNITTYKDDKYKTLSEDQKAYVDYVRWMNRYNLFKTMNPAEGIDLIETELKERPDLSEENRTELEAQVEELKALTYVNTEGERKSYNNKMMGVYSFKYYEGWTPKMRKTAAEMPIGHRIKHFAKGYTMSQHEYATMMDDTSTGDTGLPHKYLDRQSGRNDDQLQDLNTWDMSSLFLEFTNTMLDKQHFDMPFAFGRSLVEYFQEQQIHKPNDNVKGLEIQLAGFLSNVLAKDRDNNQLGIGEIKTPVIDKDGKHQEDENSQLMYTTRYVDYNKVVKGARNLVSFNALAFSIGSIVRHANSLMRTFEMGVFQPLFAKGFKVVGIEIPNNTNLGSSMMAFIDVFNARMGKNSVTRGFENLTGNLPDAVNSISVKSGILGNTSLLNSFKELGFAIDRIGDVNAYRFFQMALLRNIYTTDKNTGKRISMADAYKFKEDGSYTYVGVPRYRDAITGEIITELTQKEWTKMLAEISGYTGGFRPDEQVEIERYTLGKLVMQFKKHVVPIVEAAISTNKEGSLVLGNYVPTGEVTEFEGISVPDVKWEKGTKEGYAISTIKAVDIVLRQLGLGVMIWRAFGVKTSRAQALRDWENMSPQQKKNIVVLLSKLTTFMLLKYFIREYFGDDDDDDKNLLKMLANRSKNEAIQGINYVEYFKIASGETATLGRLEKLIDGLDSLIFESFVGGERIQSGKYREGYFGIIPNYKGVPQIATNLPIISSIWSGFRFMNDYENLEESIKQTIERNATAGK